MNAAILFEPDGYVLKGRQLMGRRAAGAAFLRAAVAGRGGERLWGFTPHKRSADVFAEVVRELDPTAETGWIPAGRLDLLAARGVLYRPDSILGVPARLRLRAGPGAYSLCGVTHTLSSEGAQDGVVAMLNAPLMPWDALICTSAAAVGVITATAEAEIDYQLWRSRGDYRPTMPQLPIIPLGVHSGDFAVSQDQRAAARQKLGLEEDEVATLFAGRLSFAGKAHPFQMYTSLQAVAEATGKRLVLMQAGQFFNEPIERAMRGATETFAPGVRNIFVDGKDDALYAASFAAADIFMSLADNIQETFGLTPIEGMAAGLPVLVTDWNGYKDTVRDGIDGFRIPTWAPGAGAGEPIGRDFEVGAINYDLYISRTSTTVSADMDVLRARLTDLVLDPALRRRMGAAGQAQARTVYDWSVVYRQYKELWAELDAMRGRAVEDPGQAAWLAGAPWAQAGRLDPFAIFALYPTSLIDASTMVRAIPGKDAADYVALTTQPALHLWQFAVQRVERVFATLAQGPASVGRLSSAAGMDLRAVTELVSRLAKMELVRLSPPAA